uniref:Uncharacterized protein n=1 Tax=Trichogramma kaykai TaxID=54128 RepID=A0ABD2XJ74_9HYME
MTMWQKATVDGGYLIISLGLHDILYVSSKFYIDLSSLRRLNEHLGQFFHTFYLFLSKKSKRQSWLSQMAGNTRRLTKATVKRYTANLLFCYRHAKFIKHYCNGSSSNGSSSGSRRERAESDEGLN